LRYLLFSCANMFRQIALLVSMLAALLFCAGCASPRYDYRYVPGRTAALRDGIAMAPPEAPPQVLTAVAAANRIAGSPYAYGGGHRADLVNAYDCSGAMSYVLRGAGLLRGAMTSRGFRRYGEEGEGGWISVYARRGHVFLVIAGLRFDTGYTDGSKGPQWTTLSRPAPGAVLRHPRGL
jgi:hypothetical protein